MLSRYTGNQIVAHEFDYNVTDQLVYDQNGVQVHILLAANSKDVEPALSLFQEMA